MNGQDKKEMSPLHSRDRSGIIFGVILALLGSALLVIPTLEFVARGVFESLPLSVGIMAAGFAALVFSILAFRGGESRSDVFKLWDSGVVPTSYGDVKKRGARVPFSEVAASTLIVAPQGVAGHDQPPSFRWILDSARFGRCEVDSTVAYALLSNDSERKQLLKEVESRHREIEARGKKDA